MSSNYIQLNPDTKEHVRKLYNLEPKKLEQGVEILDQWIKKQSFFLKKDYDKRYLESSIIDAKGSIEKAKEKIEKTCALRTMLPKYFIFNDIREDFKNITATFCAAIPTPKLTPDHHRAILVKFHNDEYFAKMTSYMDYYRIVILMYEYLKVHDYCAGYIFLADLSAVNIMTFISKLNPVEFGNYSLILWKTMSMRVKKIILVSNSTAMDALVAIVKPLMTAKLANRIVVCKSLEEAHSIVPKDVLPVEFGGTERSYLEMQNEWLCALSEARTAQYLSGVSRAGVHATYNNMHTYQHMAGSFLTLNVD